MPNNHLMVCVLVSACDLERTTKSDDQQEREAGAYYCSRYSEAVCDLIRNTCAYTAHEGDLPENSGMLPEWCPDGIDTDACHAKIWDWRTACILDVQQDCIDYYVAAEDKDSFIDIVTVVCGAGYSPDRSDAYASSYCVDLSNPADDYAPEYPYEDFCPCITSLQYYEKDSAYYCGVPG